MKIRKKIIIHGIVQGVGFRPYIHKLVQKYHLAGWVCNSNQGVEMEIEGEENNINIFLENFKDNLPPLAIVENIKVKKLPWLGYANFKIKESNNNHAHPIILMPPDVSVCEDCLRELDNPADRRYHYPFINCTNCGPRFTIIEDMPYDRGKTTMKNFPMCPACNAEYKDINNRRYHAQPNACPVCGPEVYLYEGSKKIVTKDPIGEAQTRLIKGQIGAIKGLGGFHLACDASNYSAVLRLREVKQRDEKPFAVMVENRDRLQTFCHLSEYARKYLESKEKPIVILKKKKDNYLSPEIAPGNDCIGVMLPYTPLHFLLLQKSNLVLVMTSANFSDEPIMIQDEEALKNLSHQVDFLLIHNRAIHNRCDDSVLKVSYNRPIFIRRSRGYAPFPIVLPKNSKQILAVGPEQKNTVCFTRDHYAFPSQHLGDLKNKDSFEAYQEAVKRLSRVFQFNPEMIACDLHPDYLSTSYAEQVAQKTGLPLLRIQHHHAHIASCMAENQLTEKVIGIAFDGTGLGEDNHIWGGEFLVANLRDYRRVGHLKYQTMPGGEQAIRQPWRMAYSYLYSILGEKIVHSNLELIKRRTSKELYLLNQMMDKRINSPFTSSCGRLFDAIAALINLRDEVNFEGQAAVELEAMCQSKYRDHYSYSIEEETATWIVNTEAMFFQIIHEMERHENMEKIATKFHNTIADLTLSMCVKMRNKYNINLVVLSGGVFQNSFLLNRTIGELKEENFKIYIHQKMPPNDACISLGQAVIANART